MEIMNYSQMIENSNIITALANKTIECSKDYVESRKDDIIDQMMEYLALTVSDIFASGIDLDSHFSAKASRGYGLSFGSFGGDGTGARLQFWYNQYGMYIRAYFNESGYWYTGKSISDTGLKNLIDNWDAYKRSWNDAITNGIQHVNSHKTHQLEKQLKLHEAVKNFQI